MNKKIQCKDLPEEPILIFLFELKSENKGWATRFEDYENSIYRALPKNTPEKVALKKMEGLIERGLVSGCSCGCRGDFEITDKGIEYLKLKLEKWIKS
jgi:hypothetical protein